jgi:ABC-2 type transport system ATP-binding protein
LPRAGQRVSTVSLCARVLELIELSRRFENVVALDDVSFTVPDAQIVGFVGRNGSGKTTTMRIALGVLEPHAGEVRWRGRRADATARRRFGYMPEERGLYPRMRVLEQLVYLARLHGVDRAVAGRRATELFQMLQVEATLDDRVESLSLGNQQRVQLAAALVHEPDLLVLDEPFSGLDPTGVDVLAAVLARQARERGVPVVFSSHQLELVESLCDRVVLIERGRVLAQGAIDELRASRTRNLLRLEVGGAPEGWFEVLPGVRLERSLPTGVVLELTDDVDPQRVLDLARQQGEVLHFSRVRPTLSELFREVVQA